MESRSSLTEWSARAAAVCVAGALLLASPCASAQESEAGTEKPPRPKVVNDGMFRVDRVGYGIPYYFQEGKDYSDEDAHVYYAPAFLLSADPEPASIESRSIKYHFDENNESLTLYFKRAADPEKIGKALRRHLQKTARKESSSIIREGTEPYRVAPLSPGHIIFRSVKEYLREDGTRKHLSSKEVAGVTRQDGGFTVDFYDVSRNLAEKFIEELRNNVTQIEYIYYFAGVSDEQCSATFENILDQDIDLLKDLEGDGGEGYVARHQVASIAEKAVTSGLYTARCSDPLNAQQLLNGLLAKVGQGETLEIDGWDKLNELVKFDENSFKADVKKSLSTVEDDTVREIMEEVFAESETEAETKSGAAEGGVGIKGVFGVKAGAKWAKASSEARSKAKSNFEDVYRKQGIAVEFEGEKFVPKSVDVHTAADLRSRLGKTVTIEVNIPAGAEGRGTMRLTESDRTVEVPKRDFEEVRNELNTLKRAFDSKVSSLQAKDTTLDSRLNRLRSRLRKNVEDMEDDIDELGSELQILTKSYKFARGANYRTQQYITDINTAEYPVAAIIAWDRAGCENEVYKNYGYSSNFQPKSPQIEGIISISKWLIRIDWRFFSGCDFAYIDIMYFPRKIANGSSFYAYKDNVNETIPLMGGGDRDDE